MINSVELNTKQLESMGDSTQIFSSTGIGQQHMAHGFLAGRLRKPRSVDATVDRAIAGMGCSAWARDGGEHLAKLRAIQW